MDHSYMFIVGFQYTLVFQNLGYFPRKAVDTTFQFMDCFGVRYTQINSRLKTDEMI